MAAGWCLPQSIAYTMESSIGRSGCCKPWRPRGSGTVASAPDNDGKWAASAAVVAGHSGVGAVGRNRGGTVETREGAVVMRISSDDSSKLSAEGIVGPCLTKDSSVRPFSRPATAQPFL